MDNLNASPSEQFFNWTEVFHGVTGVWLYSDYSVEPR